MLALCRLAEQSISGQAGSAILPTGTEAPMPCTESDRDAIQDASPAGYLVAGAFFAARDRTEAEQLASRAGCPLQALYTRPGLPASGQAAPMAPGDARLPIIGGILGRIRPRRRT